MSFLRFLSLFLLLSVTGCQIWREGVGDKPHVIVIAVDSLNFESASCEEESEDRDGFQSLCREALRFTHFYTPTPMSQGAMATLLTGLDLKDHEIFHNGNQGIPYTVVTAAEKALSQGYRTAFFSGGPPLLSKSGFHQGFETYDDEFFGSENMYVPAKDNLQKAFNWLEKIRGGGFVTLYLPDMQFPFMRTFSDDGKEREKSPAAQRQEIGESLAGFFDQLKKKKMWDQSWVILVGLNGEPSPARKGIVGQENLFRENVHIPFFLKMPKANGKSQSSASFDALLSMKDAGQLVLQILDLKIEDAERITQRLDEMTENPNQVLEIRSDWRSWWFGMAPALSLRTYDYLIFPKEKMVLYHSVVDKYESTPLSESQVDRNSLKWLKYRFGESFDKNQKFHSELYDVLRLMLNERQARTVDIIPRLPEAAAGGLGALIRADRAIQDRDWNILQGSGVPLYKYVAAQNGITDPKQEKIELNNPCDKLFTDKKPASALRRCHDPLFLALLDWEKRFKDSDALFWEKSFMRKFRFFVQYKRVAYINLFLELNWDVDVASLVGPSLTELYLNLPEKAALRKKIEMYKIPLQVSFP